MIINILLFLNLFYCNKARDIAAVEAIASKILELNKTRGYSSYIAFYNSAIQAIESLSCFEEVFAFLEQNKFRYFINGEIFNSNLQDFLITNLCGKTFAPQEIPKLYSIFLKQTQRYLQQISLHQTFSRIIPPFPKTIFQIIVEGNNLKFVIPKSLPSKCNLCFEIKNDQNCVIAYIYM